MIDFLSSEDFRFLWLPFFTTVLTIIIKLIYKDKRLSSVTWDDFSVAPNLMITALFIFLIKMSLYASDIKKNPSLAVDEMDSLLTRSIVFALMLAGILATMWIIRESGWKKNIIGQVVLKKGTIIISDILGAVYLTIAYNF